MGGLIDIEYDVPLDMTLAEWKASRRRPRQPRRRVGRTLRRELNGGGPAGRQRPQIRA
jgi:hypothetical protein